MVSINFYLFGNILIFLHFEGIFSGYIILQVASFSSSVFGFFLFFLSSYPLCLKNFLLQLFQSTSTQFTSSWYLQKIFCWCPWFQIVNLLSFEHALFLSGSFEILLQSYFFQKVEFLCIYPVQGKLTSKIHSFMSCMKFGKLSAIFFEYFFSFVGLFSMPVSSPGYIEGNTHKHTHTKKNVMLFLES